MTLQEFLEAANYTKKTLGCGCKGASKKTWVLDVYKITSERKVGNTDNPIIIYYVNGRIVSRDIFIIEIETL